MPQITLFGADITTSGGSRVIKNPKMNNDDLIENIDPLDYVDNLIGLLKSYSTWNGIDKILTAFDRKIINDYLDRLGKKDNFNEFKQIISLLEDEKDLINICIKTILSYRERVINCNIYNDLSINLGLVLAASNFTNGIDKRDYLYAAFHEKFIHGISTSFGNLRQNEVVFIKKKSTNHVFRFDSKKEADFSQQSSFDLILIKVEKGVLENLTFIQASSGPNCKNFTHAIQINNVKDWFTKKCMNSLQELKKFINKYDLSKYDTLLKGFKDVKVQSDKVTVVVGQAYGDPGMTAGMMKRSGIEVFEPKRYWEFITGKPGSNPFRAEQIAGYIVSNLVKRGEGRNTQKLGYWQLMMKTLEDLINDLNLDDYIIP